MPDNLILAFLSLIIYIFLLLYQEEQSEIPEEQPESQPTEGQEEQVMHEISEVQEDKKEFKLRAEEDEPILPPPKVGLDENSNDLDQVDFENQKNSKNLSTNENISKKKKRLFSKTGEEILAEIKSDPNKVGWKTRPSNFDWKKRSDLGLGKGVKSLTTDFKFSGWRFIF